MLDTLRNRVSAFIKPEAPMPNLEELAFTESVFNFNFREFNPDLLVRAKGGLRVYDLMRVDDQVKATLTLKKNAVIAPGWEIRAAEDTPEANLHADFIEHTFLDMDGTINRAILNILTGLDYGFSITEKVWKFIEVGDFAGKVGLKALKPKKPHFFEFDSDDFGNLKPNGLVQTTVLRHEMEQRLPVDKFIIYTYQKEFSNHYGISDLRPAYRSWWSKDNLIKFWNIYNERFGAPLTIGTHKTNDPAQVNLLKTILSNIQNKTSITMPKDVFGIELLEAKKKSNAEFKEAIAYHDRAIARSMLIPDRLSEAGEKGAFSQALVHFDVFLIVVEQLREEQETIVMEEQVIRPLMAMNFPGVVNIPKFKFKPLTKEQKLELAKTFADAVQKGAIVVKPEDEDHLREVLDFPIPERTEEEPPTPPPLPPAPGEIPEEPPAEFASRAKTRFERRVNFQQISTTLTKVEEDTVKSMQDILTRQRDDLTAFVTRKQLNGGLTSSMINNVTLKGWGDFKKEVRQMFDKTYDQGIDDGKSELPKQFITATQGKAVAPDKAIGYFAAKTDFVVRGVREPLTTATQAILLNALRTGEGVPVTVSKLQKAYLPYLATGEVIIDDKQAEPFRLETLVRTNMSESYAYGRRAVGESEELKDFVIGYQFSEILDDRTTDISRFVDGKVISVESPSLDILTYPLHFNDRGIFVYVTQDDLPGVTFMSESEAAQVVSMKGL